MCRTTITLGLCFAIQAGCQSDASSPPPSSGSGGSDTTGSTTTGGAGSTSSSGGGATTSGAGGSTTGPTVVLSEDFESGNLDPQRWTPQVVSGGTYEVSSTQHHGGQYALHVAHSGFSTMLRLQGAPVFPVPNERFYSRVWFYVDGPLPGNHVIWLEAGTVANDVAETRVGMNAGQMDVNHWPGDEDLRDPDAPVTSGTWHCLEVMVDGMADRLEVRLDGTERPHLSTTDWVASEPANGNTNPLSDWSPPYDALRIGWELGSGDIWFDDLGVSHEAWLGCD